jgi:hypothetical protein
MKKLSLKLEELSVESFRTEQTEERRGTVPAHCGLATDMFMDTCDESCEGTCWSCKQTCGQWTCNREVCDPTGWGNETCPGWCDNPLD